MDDADEAAAFDAALGGDDDADSDDSEQKGLLGMKFMKRGAKRMAEEQLEREALAGRDDYDDPSSDSDSAAPARRKIGNSDNIVPPIEHQKADGEAKLAGSRKLVDGSSLVGKRKANC